MVEPTGSGIGSPISPPSSDMMVALCWPGRAAGSNVRWMMREMLLGHACPKADRIDST